MQLLETPFGLLLSLLGSAFGPLWAALRHLWVLFGSLWVTMGFFVGPFWKIMESACPEGA